MKKTIISLLITLSALNIFAQQRGTVKGNVIDINGKVIEYAMVSVLRANDSATVGNGWTLTDGNFNITSLPFGDFMIEVEVMGYKAHYSAPFTLSEKNPTKNFAKFKLTQRSTTLDAVEITAKKEMIQSNLDKQVFNVESSIITEGETAIEVLEEIPSVDVDLDGNVSLRGSENVTVLIDGRVSNLTLDQIPAEQIESIEVINNPSARLEPDGMAGILNVILKKKKDSGFNGLVTLGGALSMLGNKPYFDRYNGGFNLNYNYNKINIFLNYDLRHFGHHSYGELDRTAWFEQDTSRLWQENHSDGGGWSHNISTGLDWFINSKNTLSFTFGFNTSKHGNESSLNSTNSRWLIGTETPFNKYDEKTSSSMRNYDFNAAINYKKTFETKGQELTADLSFSQRTGKNIGNEHQTFEVPQEALPYFQETTSDETNRNAAAQIDFITPVGNGGRIETGYKLSYRYKGQDYSLFSGNAEDKMMEDSSQRNNFDFSELINAAYFIYSNTFWEKFKIQLGLRAELANTVSDLKSANKIHYKNYFNLFPTVHLRYDFSLEHSLQLSYSRRVTRPRVWWLNPFIDYSDRQNWRTGNPNLQPEFVNSVDLSYLMTVKKSSLNVSVFYRQRQDIISRYTQLLNDSTTLTTYENLNSSHNVGLELTYGQRIWKFWKITLTGSLYYESIESNDLIEQSLSTQWNWRIRLNQTFSLPKDWDLQLNFRYSSPSLTAGSMGWGNNGVGQGKRSARYGLNFGVKKTLFNCFTISLNARNIVFNRKNNVHTYSYGEKNGYDAHSVHIRQGLSINLTLSYKFNNYKKRKETPSGLEDMMEGED
ncbi:MAG: TonB-dependent receptor [Bacteroidales bacterium]|nr:TonB-dependent receptor [Bacteroidales bacterium]